MSDHRISATAPNLFGPRPGFAKRSKYRAQRTEIGGIWFDSKGEAQRYSNLLLLQKIGDISGLKLQPEFPLEVDGKPVLIRSQGFPNGRRAKYVADFEYIDRCGARIIEDFKGFDTPESRLKRAMVEAQYGIRIVITGRAA